MQAQVLCMAGQDSKLYFPRRMSEFYMYYENYIMQKLECINMYVELSMFPLIFYRDNIS